MKDDQTNETLAPIIVLYTSASDLLSVRKPGLKPGEDTWPYDTSERRAHARRLADFYWTWKDRQDMKEKRLKRRLDSKRKAVAHE